MFIHPGLFGCVRRLAVRSLPQACLAAAVVWSVHSNTVFFCWMCCAVATFTRTEFNSDVAAAMYHLKTLANVFWVVDYCGFMDRLNHGQSRASFCN